jgi:23S rRNA pseudouridine955/2504/2580 synthase
MSTGCSTLSRRMARGRTSGVLLVARTPGSAAFFSKRFSGRSAKKIYWALVVGVPEPNEGTIDAPLAKQPGTGGEKMCVDPENGQPAKTRYRVVDRAGNRAAWVELQPLTGRTHQLRVHLAAIGHPIVGDGKYGGQDAFLSGSISRKMHLHARRLIIEHPDGSPLDATAELPEHFAASMAQLGFDQADSDATPDEGPPPPRREDKKQAAKAHAKQYRKERRGERRKRADGPTGRKPTGQKAKASPARKPGAKPAGARPARPQRPSGPPKGRGR